MAKAGQVDRALDANRWIKPAKYAWWRSPLRSMGGSSEEGTEFCAKPLMGCLAPLEMDQVMPSVDLDMA